MNKYYGKKLSLVGVGIKAISHITKESLAHIKSADIVLCLLNDPVIEQWLINFKLNIELLDTSYFSSPLRKESYKSVTDKILLSLDKFNFVCVVFYGHPSVFADPGLESIYIAKKNGAETVILPGVSAEDCMFADLRINPGSCGCYSIEATDLLLYQRSIDVSSHLTIWQAGMIFSITHDKPNGTKGITLLMDYLLNFYDSNAFVFLYEAAIYPGTPPVIIKVKLADLHKQVISTICSLYLPPTRIKSMDESIKNLLKI